MALISTAQAMSGEPQIPNSTALDVVLCPDIDLEDERRREFIRLFLDGGAQAKRYPDSDLLKEEIRKKYFPVVLRFRETHGRLPKSVTQYT
jgi:hypothetical protein